jgi:intracellular septation protein A
VLALLRFAVAEFGPLLAFWALSLTFGIKTAIAGSLAAILADGAWRLWRGRPFTRLYLVVSALTLGFGAVDLCLRTPFLTRFLLVFEAPITNALTGAAFVAGAYGAKPMLMEMAEARPDVDVPDTAETRRFFRLFTLIWAGYFFLKAGVYLWLAATLPLMQALALRSLLGGISLAAMTALSVTQGRRLFRLCRRLGWLGPQREAAAGT